MDLIEIRLMLAHDLVPLVHLGTSWSALHEGSLPLCFTTNVSLTYQQHFLKGVCALLHCLIAQCQQWWHSGL